MTAWGFTLKQKAQTHCLRGHALLGKNLYNTKDGKRQCIECKRIRARKLHKLPLRKNLIKALTFAKQYLQKEAKAHVERLEKGLK